jgi:hypothetical protein
MRKLSRPAEGAAGPSPLSVLLGVHVHMSEMAVGVALTMECSSLFVWCVAEFAKV